MRLKIYLFFLLLFSSRMPVAYSISPHEINQKNLRAHVNFLCSKKLEGRQTGSRGEKLATEYIAKQFHDLGLEPAGDNGSYFQEFSFTGNALFRKKNRLLIIQHGRNVLAKLNVTAKPSPIIILSAHVDHLGRGKLIGSRARENEIGLIHVGADDNASGVASMLEIAAKLSTLKSQGKLTGKNDILFAAWSGEELGILGSSYFIKNHIKTKSLQPNINAMINLDMVGHLRKYLVLQGIGSSQDWPRLIKQTNSTHVLPLLTQNDTYLPTDTTAFYLHHIPTLNFFTGAHEDYHTPRDTPDKLNYNGIKTISEFLTDLILVMENKSNAISFHEAQPSKHDVKRKYKIYLGTIPDYASAMVSGVKLAGVANHSPAELAGLKQDDVIIELAGKKINDIYDYTDVINGLRVGKRVKVIVLRENSKIDLNITARYRE